MTDHQDWCYQSPLPVLKQRAFLLAEIRAFFAAKNVMEVETPVLSSAANTDLQIAVFSTQSILKAEQCAYLRTSPEFFHKRLLASGSGDIFEIAKVFRHGESTALHNPEFSLLEWYRLGFDLRQLMNEVLELIEVLALAFALKPLPVKVVTYQALFIELLQIDPFDLTQDQLNQLAKEAGYHGSTLSRAEALDFMFAIKIEPLLNNNQAYLIHDFPIEQAALAKAHPEFSDRCLRFEFLWGSVELANGYQELTDATEQLRRFENDNKLRQWSDKSELPIDLRLLAALHHGLPQCSGVAIGLDRLLMCLLNKSKISDVLGFNAINS